ncbi:hypothetical protein NP233_g5084 [Leucocoprinus birnbaumii]|uniref:H-type lectin domain-containing protein n=1 Tax=Leucocoprinus birnbaumii TaxID=56174 RepID=A0AAD5VZV1_9AGAR|nr:hypothetical protein NP233_g5084 [Leucocoprinus birnbaumii]
MASVTQFDTQTVRDWTNPQDDTAAIVKFPYEFVAPPRLALGLSQLDVDYKFNIRVKATAEKIQRDSAIYHITSWSDTLLYSGVVNSLDLAPANLEFRAGEHMRDLLANPNSPDGHGWRLETTAVNVDRKGFTLKIRTWADTILYRAQAAWVAYPEDREHIFSTSVNTDEVRPWTSPQAKTSKYKPFLGIKFARPPIVFVGLNTFDIKCGLNFRVNARVDNVSTSGFTWHLDTWGGTSLYSAGATIIAFD